MFLVASKLRVCRNGFASIVRGWREKESRKKTKMAAVLASQELYCLANRMCDLSPSYEYS